jgi:hypothetical protein
MAAPEVNDSTTIDSDAHRGTDLGVLMKVIDKGLTNWLESRVNQPLR